jgi:tRNA-dihydrouridine synthase B
MAFRLLCREQGAAIVYAEMASGKGLWHDSRRTEDLLRISEGEKPVGYQIFGSEPEIMAAAARKLNGRENALLDINMGCPVNKVVRNGEGAALLRDMDLAGRVMEAAAAASEKPVTAKIRIGWDRGSINAVEMAKTLESAGAAAIAVHGRTREQFYSGEADWEAIRMVKEAVGIPVIGNGDVRGGADAVRLLEETGCDYVMIARGALGNPWIFREANALYAGGEAPAPVSLDERFEMLLRHLDMLVEEKGERAAVMEMRKHVAWYLKGVRGAAALRGAANTASGAGELRLAVESAAGKV